MRRWHGIARGSAITIAFTAAATAPGCYGHQCDANPGAFPPDGGDAGRGHMLDDNTYETNAIDEPWINYPGNVHLSVTYPKEVARPMSWLEAYVGTTSQPNQSDSSTWVLASGALAEVLSSDRTGFKVLNGTCASYYARFVVHFAPRPATDAGVDATENSARADASAEGSVD